MKILNQFKITTLALAFIAVLVSASPAKAGEIRGSSGNKNQEGEGHERDYEIRFCRSAGE